MIAVFIALLLVLNLASALAIKIMGGHLDSTAVVFGMLAALMGVYAARALIWLLVGKRYQLSYAYPLLSINYPIAFFVGVCCFGEHFSYVCLAGTLTITAGVACVASSGYREERGV
ncbi:MAG: hypothetical protein JW888_02290 [Pirellulales bacterium]|nr:hypothetical protein [Pirellulales bacterium]